MTNHDLYYQALRDKQMYPTIAYGSAEEIWKPINGCAFLYEISNHGQVRSVERTTYHSDGKVTKHRSRILKQQTNKKGYNVVRISVNGRKYSFIVHRLVAEHFLDNPKCFPEINHKNEIKTDNQVNNLEWCDTAYNVEYSQAKSCKLISPDGEVVDVFNFAKFARENGLSNGKISALLNGERKQHKGWRAYVS